ncbi:TIGR02285 family protein [Bdellovibrio sp. HCB117]|uniref:TIGR02285 family protein n=1 Tax=Bdellovibrio sp. HCB117 TaxID=3394359 RepID=UPI0039B49885
MRVCTFLLIILSFYSAWAQAPTKAPQTIYWLFFDLPPAVDFRASPPGYMVEIHQLLTARMPEYKHQVVEVPFLRILQQLKKKMKVCSLMVLKNPERAKFIEFGTPLLQGYPAGVITRKDDPKISKYVVKPGLIDFDRILKDESLTLGLVAERFYGKKINSSLAKKNEVKLVEKKSLNVDHELKALLGLGRIDVYLGYPFEADNDKFTFYFVKEGLEVLDPRVGCEKSEFGKEVVAKTESLRKEFKLDAEFIKVYNRYYSPDAQKKYKSLQ